MNLDELEKKVGGLSLRVEDLALDIKNGRNEIKEIRDNHIHDLKEGLAAISEDQKECRKTLNTWKWILGVGLTLLGIGIGLLGLMIAVHSINP